MLKIDVVEYQLRVELSQVAKLLLRAHVCIHAAAAITVSIGSPPMASLVVVWPFQAVAALLSRW